jgi:hypothetical protein
MGIPNVTALKVFIRQHESATLDEVAHAINICLRLKPSDLKKSDATNYKLEAGQMLVSLRKRVEIEGLDWWPWARDRLAYRNRKDIETVMRLADAGEAVATDLTDAVVIEATARIKACMVRAAGEIMAMGCDLAIVKRHLVHGQFLQWLKTEFAMSERTAERYIGAFNVFGSKSDTVTDLPPGVMYALAAPSTTPEVRTEALALAAQGQKVTQKTVAGLKAKRQRAAPAPPEPIQPPDATDQVSDDLDIIDAGTDGPETVEQHCETVWQKAEAAGAPSPERQRQKFLDRAAEATALGRHHGLENAAPGDITRKVMNAAREAAKTWDFVVVDLQRRSRGNLQ